MMPVEDVFAALRGSPAYLPPSEAGVARLVSVHPGPLAARVVELGARGVPASAPPPFLAAECTPSLPEVWSPALGPWWDAGRPDPASLARALTATGLRGLLVLMGMRITAASVTDERAIPPTRAALLSAAEAPLDAGLTVAARAWTKHAGRSSDPWWGAPTGASAEKNGAARVLLVKVLTATTWWNVFGHASYSLVYEARVASGHGARWAEGGQRFVGFLDPFDAGQRG
jgi:hypothetical protein